jgi:hypothetical protein
MFTIGSLFPRLTSAGTGKTHHAYFRLPRLSDRLAFGSSADDVTVADAASVQAVAPDGTQSHLAEEEEDFLNIWD